MTPFDKVSAAISFAFDGKPGWNIRCARAALKALAECELPDRMYNESGFINTGDRAVRNLFSSVVRAIEAES